MGQLGYARKFAAGKLERAAQSITNLQSHLPQSALFPHWERDAFKEAFTLKFYDKAATEITGSQTSGAGIGFTSIVFDEASDNYRYYLDTGAHIEFDKNGALVAQKGDKGERGATGERGPKGDKGADGGSKVPVGRPSGSLPDGSIWIA